MKRHQAAIIGAGFMGRTHIEALRRLGNVDVKAVAAASKSEAQTLASAFGIERSASDYREILEDPAIDAIHICTPNALHFEIAEAALKAGKHVICEKPLATTSAQAASLLSLARERDLRHATNHNLRYYPMVQQMRAMREAGELGEILIAQGTYSQDWLFYDTDWNWRVEASEGGPSRVMADIGSHWCDMAENVTGLRITSLNADLQTFHKTRKRPRGPVETFQSVSAEDRIEVPVDTEDFGSVQFHMGDRARGAFTASQVSAGRKNRLSLEIFGTKASVAWDQERPNELWIGSRDSRSALILKDPALLLPQARPYADFPGGHSEGYDDTFKQIFRRFYQSIDDTAAVPVYPLFDDGLRQLRLVEAEIESSRSRRWVDIAE
ncbi:MAG TPA: Gfo/Idh/MocA family oxidoreductase [Bryobacteraceae bacterium]|jgi:predicted dehydrogenase|nr:Gfo/Idh/MocA family oxidoreductase [Bryobacteraceae bacterium]